MLEEEDCQEVVYPTGTVAVAIRREAAIFLPVHTSYLFRNRLQKSNPTVMEVHFRQGGVSEW